MDLLCNAISLTWYPGAVGTTDDPLVLLSSDNAVPLSSGSGLAGTIEQAVQRADYHRAASPDFFPRGNAALSLEWVEIREIADRMEAQEIALALAAGLPQVQGWVLIELGGRETTWSMASAVIRSLRWTHDDRAAQLSLQWGVDGGALAIYDAGETPPSIYPDGEILAGPTGTPTNRGAFLLGPNRTHPAP